MFCRQCGKQLEDAAKFCSNCGTPVVPIVQAPQEDRAKQVAGEAANQAKAAAEAAAEKAKAVAGAAFSTVAAAAQSDKAQQAKAAAEAAAEKAKVAAQAAVSKSKTALGNLDAKDLFQKAKKLVLGAACVLAAMAVVGSFLPERCDYKGCRDEVLRGDYCAAHVCGYSGCTSARSSSSYLCAYHARLAQQAQEQEAASAEKNLVFSNIKITHNSSYTVVTGKVTNTGKRTYKFVKVKGSFKNSSGKVVDTDWTYAVGSEGLAPGESTEFRLSVSKDTSIKKCDVTILDYDIQ